ncbi:hypothetical protein L1887_00818 [Cichorium endivia]|nr:hypothetical protein L1887_00818 [Cichorium endivia]
MSHHRTGGLFQVQAFVRPTATVLQIQDRIVLDLSLINLTTDFVDVRDSFLPPAYCELIAKAVSPQSLLFGLLKPNRCIKVEHMSGGCDLGIAVASSTLLKDLRERIAAMILVWKYGEKSGYESWKGLSWGIVPLLLGRAFCACAWHFFYNSESLKVLVAIQGALTVIGNATVCIPAYLIYKLSQESSIGTSTFVSISILLLLSIFMIFKEFIEGDVHNGASLFAAINIFIFKKAMPLYTKERERNEVITAEDCDAGLEDSRVEDSSGDVDAGVKDSDNISNGCSCLLVVKPKLIEFEWVISELFKSLRCLAVPWQGEFGSRNFPGF